MSFHLITLYFHYMLNNPQDYKFYNISRIKGSLHFDNHHKIHLNNYKLEYYNDLLYITSNEINFLCKSSTKNHILNNIIDLITYTIWLSCFKIAFLTIT